VAIRSVLLIFADTPPPPCIEDDGADASALYGREQDGREREKVAAHHTPSG
jgi:hypothetical protein